MVYRGDGEPEYIDDDDFFDPDEFGESGGRRSNVLGGSGSRQARAEGYEPPDERLRAGAGKQDSRVGGGTDDRKQAKTERKSLKARNPAPSVANSEERRARLAGKHQKKPARSESPKRPDTSKSETDKAARNPGGWRERFARRDKSSREAPEPSASSKALASVTGKIGALRGRLRRNDGKDDKAGNQREDSKSASQASRAASGGRFGASRGPTRPAESRRADAFSKPQDSKPGGVTRARASKTPKIASGDWLDLDRKLDLVGVGLVFGAIVFVFSALSPEQAAIGGLHTVIGQLLGWGAVAVPIAMFAVGLWLIVRHFGDEAAHHRSGYAWRASRWRFCERAGPDAVSRQLRLSRAMWSQIASVRRCRQAYQDGRGGGLIGGWLYSALVINLTELGGFVAVFMALTIAAMLTTRSSMVELSVVVISLSRNLRTRIGQVLVQRRAARLQAQQEQLAMAQNESHVRVRKPDPAQLSAAPAGGPALPEPSSDWMPIPSQLRAFLGRRAKAEALQEEEPAAIETPAQSRDKGLMRRFLSRRPADSGPAQAAKPIERAGRLERFLNLGNDLPPSAAGPSTANLSAPPPRPRRANPPPSVGQGRPSRPIKPLEPQPEPPAFAPSPDPAADAEPAQAAPPNADRLGAADSSAIYEAPASSEIGAQPVERKPPGKGKSASAAVSAKPAKQLDWDLPDYRELLNAGTASDFDEAALQQQAQIIEDTLASFGAPGRVVEVNSGPVITQYGVQPAYIMAKTGKRNRVKVGAIAKLDKDLQLALGARSLRMEAPCAGQGLCRH